MQGQPPHGAQQIPGQHAQGQLSMTHGQPMQMQGHFMQNPQSQGQMMQGQQMYGQPMQTQGQPIQMQSAQSQQMMLHQQQIHAPSEDDVYLRGLPRDMTDERLRAVFAQY